VNFGAFIGFISVNLCVIRHFWFDQKTRKQWLLDLVLPALGFAICFYIWLHLSPLALALGGLWMALGLIYLLLLKRRVRRPEEKIREKRK
jgi:putrescine importer